MIKHLIILWLLLTPAISFAKQAQADTTKFRWGFYFIVNFSDGREPVFTRYYFMDRKHEEYISFLKEINYKNAFRHLKADVVAIVKLKPGVHALTLADLYNRYKIPKQYQKLMVKYDDDIIDHPETILTSANQIKSVKVKNSKKGRYVEIISINYETMKKREKEQKNEICIGQQ